jgi:hypothetical protein
MWSMLLPHHDQALKHGTAVIRYKPEADGRIGVALFCRAVLAQAQEIPSPILSSRGRDGTQAACHRMMLNRGVKMTGSTETQFTATGPATIGFQTQPPETNTQFEIGDFRPRKSWRGVRRCERKAIAKIFLVFNELFPEASI